MLQEAVRLRDIARAGAERPQPPLRTARLCAPTSRPIAEGWALSRQRRDRAEAAGGDRRDRARLMAATYATVHRGVYARSAEMTLAL